MKIKIKDKSKIVAKDVEFTDDTYSVPSVLRFSTTPDFDYDTFLSMFSDKGLVLLNLSEGREITPLSVIAHGDRTIEKEEKSGVVVVSVLDSNPRALRSLENILNEIKEIAETCSSVNIRFVPYDPTLKMLNFVFSGYIDNINIK